METGKKKLNFTPFARRFRESTSGTVVEQDHEFGKRRPPVAGMHRLAFGAVTEKRDMPLGHLHDLITSGVLQSTFIFPDTCFISAPMLDKFWRFGGRCLIAFAESTIPELSAWIDNPFNNKYLHDWLPRAIRQCLAQNIRPDQLFRRADVLGAYGTELQPYGVVICNNAAYLPHGYQHYLDLLGLRKLIGNVVYQALSVKLNRPATEAELKQDLNKNFPGFERLAFKGWKEYGKPNYFADEELVMTAVFTALAMEREALVLTRDTDVFEQFCNLMQMLSADYAAWRVGESIHHQPDFYSLKAVATSPHKLLKEGFSDDVIQEIVLPHEVMQILSPREFTPIHVHCVLIGNNTDEPKVSISSFCLEAEMKGMLNVKAETGGMNTNRFGTRDVSAGSREINGRMHALFMIGNQRMMTMEGRTVSKLNMTRAMSSRITVTQLKAPERMIDTSAR